jgi:hypothetical protein
MRLLFAAAIGLSLTVASASAQTVTAPRVHMPAMRALHMRAPPPVYTPLQRSLALQRLLRLPNAPTLTQTIMMEPKHPFIAGQAQLNMVGGDWISGDLPAPPGTYGGYSIPSGIARIYIPNGVIEIDINASPGKRYAFDCRAYLWASAGGTPSVIYTTLPGNVTGTVSEGSDGHFLFVMDSLASGGPAAIQMTLNTTQSAEMVFYGCQISPF